jgi:hypothetical protein
LTTFETKVPPTARRRCIVAATPLLPLVCTSCDESQPPGRKPAHDLRDGWLAREGSSALRLDRRTLLGAIGLWRFCGGVFRGASQWPW